MSYNLKNKTIVMFALAFTAIIAINNVSFAEDATPTVDASVQTGVNDSADLFGLDDAEAPTKDAQATTDEQASATPDNEATNASKDVANSDKTDTEDEEDEDEDEDDSLTDDSEDDFDLDTSSVGEDLTAPDLETSSDEGAISAPKSAFENFGNIILSKVDNDLFNQMSNIEKQTTLLNLEFKREEIKDRIEAIRARRAQAKLEEKAKLLAQEEKIKEAEAERQAMLMSAEQKVKEKEIELEKVRQAKVLNDYMNEMLLMNQSWIAKNTELQLKIKEMEDERRSLILDFEDKLLTIRRESNAMEKKAETAQKAHDRVVNAFNRQIDQLKMSLSNSEDQIKQIRDGISNPFALAMNGIDENAIDMSEEYAIMDITGKGPDVVAKIVSKDGTTFTVHKGSMLKGGEVVTAITDNFVAFDNRGIKSYLYTGGTVLEYEPVVSFNNADKTPGEASKEDAPEVKKPTLNNTLSKMTNNAKKEVKSTPVRSNQSKSNAGMLKNNNTTKSFNRTTSNNTSKPKGNISSGSGMFVK